MKVFTFLLFYVVSVCAPALSFAVPQHNKIILAIFAHPDDELTVAPVLAKYARKGHKVYLAVVTDGQKGVTPHANIPAGDKLKAVREKETFCATQALGIEPPIMLEFIDGDLAKWENLKPLDAKITQLFKQLQPDVVITWGPEGGYGHLDHRMVSNIVTQIYQRGEQFTPEALYYAAASKIDLHNYKDFKSDVGYIPVTIQNTEFQRESKAI